MAIEKFHYPDADAILLSCEEDDRTEFHVHRCILIAASPFFSDLFSLPQKSNDVEGKPLIPVAETRQTLSTLLQFVYPVEDPIIDSLDELIPVLLAALKYDFLSTIVTLRGLLVEPRFVKIEPTRVYAIASRFELEEEAKIASKYTLSVNIIDAPLCEDFKHITAWSYHQLLGLHHKRAKACLELIKLPKDVKCMQCNGSVYAIHNTPKWWTEFEKRAREELSVRPTTETIFTMEFLSQVANASGCPRCAGSVLDAWKSLEDLRKEIDALPDTI